MSLFFIASLSMQENHFKVLFLWQDIFQGLLSIISQTVILKSETSLVIHNNKSLYYYV